MNLHKPNWRLELWRKFYVRHSKRGVKRDRPFDKGGVFWLHWVRLSGKVSTCQTWPQTVNLKQWLPELILVFKSVSAFCDWSHHKTLVASPVNRWMLFCTPFSSFGQVSFYILMHTCPSFGEDIRLLTGSIFCLKRLVPTFFGMFFGTWNGVDVSLPHGQWHGGLHRNLSNGTAWKCVVPNTFFWLRLSQTIVFLLLVPL